MNAKILLAIETATPVGSVALYEGSNLIAYAENRQDRAHARLLLPMIDSLLTQTGIAKSALSAVAVGKGPGSYTGLRIGVSTAKGLCMALDIPLLAVGTLDAIATQAKSWAQAQNAWICPMLDARRMEVYAQFFDSELMPQSTIEAVVVTETAFDAQLAQQRIIFLGDGAAKCKATLTAHSPNAIVIEGYTPSAAAVGQLAATYFTDTHSAIQPENLTTFEPFYLKDFVVTKPKPKA